MKKYNMILTEKQQKYQHYPLIKEQWLNKLSLLITLYQELLKNKQKQLNSKEKTNKIKAIEEHGKQLIKYSCEKDFLTHLKQKKKFDEPITERMDQI